MLRLLCLLEFSMNWQNLHKCGVLKQNCQNAKSPLNVECLSGEKAKEIAATD